MIYTVTLNPALDYVMKTGALRFDDINRSKEERLYYGGKGINVSVILTRLGAENKALGFIAGFTGNELERMLKSDGINCDFSRLNSGSTRINVKIKADAELDINAQGPDISESELEGLLEKLDEIKEGDFLVLAGSVKSALPFDIYERILSRLEGKGVNFVVDTMGKLLLNALIEECAKELENEGLSYRMAPLGVMIETPSAALISDLLAKEVEFFSIGTNDLTGYTMAVDRGNANVRYLYDAFRPAVLREIEMIIKNAKAAGITVGMCGEAAADERLIPKLVEWGLDEFSVNPSSILQTRRCICECE